MSGKEIEAKIRADALEYFEARSRLAVAKDSILDTILEAKDDHGFAQQRIADLCDVRDESGAEDDWMFHRTRVQQFLVEARRARRSPA